MIRGFAALAPAYKPVVFFSKRYTEVVIRVAYPLDPPDEIVATVGAKLDRMHDYYLGSCVGVAHSVKAVMEARDPYNPEATVKAISNVLDEHKADIASFAKAIKLPEQLSLIPRSQEEALGLDEHIYHAEVMRETAAETQAK